MPKPIEFWFTCGSTYTYLATERVRRAVADGAEIQLRCLFLGRIFNEDGRWPFPDEAAKTRYMWRDIERRAPALGLSPVLPAPYPAPQTERANRVAHVAIERGKGLPFLSASYVAWFEKGMMPGEDAHLEAALTAVGLDVAEVLSAADAPEVEAAVAANTAEARERGIFGVPTFVVGEEMFWGDDRFEDALSWANEGA